ncbi:MAG: hypothetical protein ABIG20_03750 [archaeon]
MNLGFMKGKLDVSLENVNFSPGDTIAGTVKLELKKPVKARKLVVAFIGEKTVSQASVSIGMGSSRHKPQNRKICIHKFEMTLDGEKDYTMGEYPFQIAVPSDLLSRNPQVEGALGSVVKAVQVLGGGYSRVNWFVTAYLDVPFGVNVSKTVQVNISEGAVQGGSVIKG